MDGGLETSVQSWAVYDLVKSTVRGRGSDCGAAEPGSTLDPAEDPIFPSFFSIISRFVTGHVSPPCVVAYMLSRILRR